MSLEAIYYISQVIAALALIVSLLFVGVQLNQNTQQSKQANLIAHAESLREMVQGPEYWHPLFSQPGFAEDFRFCMNRYSEASPLMKTRFHGFMFPLWLQIDSMQRRNRHLLAATMSPEPRSIVAAYPWARQLRMRRQGLSRPRGVSVFLDEKDSAFATGGVPNFGPGSRIQPCGRIVARIVRFPNRIPQSCLERFAHGRTRCSLQHPDLHKTILDVVKACFHFLAKQHRGANIAERVGSTHRPGRALTDRRLAA